MKRRVTGQRTGSHYEIHSPDGDVLRRMTLDEARADTKLAAAIERNGWESL